MEQCGALSGVGGVSGVGGGYHQALQVAPWARAGHLFLTLIFSAQFNLALSNLVWLLNDFFNLTAFMAMFALIDQSSLPFYVIVTWEILADPL